MPPKTTRERIARMTVSVRGGSAFVRDGVDRVVSEAPDRRRIGGFAEIRERSSRRERRRPTRNDFRHGLIASIYPHYVTKVEKKGRTEAELQQVLTWLTGFTKAKLAKHIAKESTLEAFFDDATLHPNASLIKGVICGHRVEETEDPLTRNVRAMDKLVDELAKGRKMEKILRA